MDWTDELREKVIKTYKDAEPTAENSMDIVNEIAEDIGSTPNGVRMILMKDGCYVKKTPAAKGTTSSSSGGSKRVSKADAQAELRNAMTEKGLTIDEDIIDKLTGKAAQYFAAQFAAI